MFYRLVYRYLWILTKLSYLSQLLLILLASFFQKKLKKPIDDQKFKNVYLGSKVFSNCKIESELDVALIDISNLSNYQLDNSILILNNNDFCDDSCFHVVNKIKKYSTNLQICLWDFDNHHAIANSLRLLFLSDIYLSAHQHNFDLLRRSSSGFLGVLPASVIQWSKEFLTNSVQYILSVPRSNELFGAHVYYAPFIGRNNIIDKVSKDFPGVFFSNLNYHNRTIEDRFAEWCHYKVHFIAPVENDLPIRLLDALITGGIPLVPVTLKSLLHALSIDRFVVFYDELNLDLLYLKVEEAIIKFDEDGAEGMIKRINFIMDHHHIDARINFLINIRH
jgi:hypothetical protein